MVLAHSPALVLQATVWWLTAMEVLIVMMACTAPISVCDCTVSAARRQNGGRNVHLVQHSHDDPGWLKTVDQYHYGSNNSIQVAGTAFILDSVVASLKSHPHRTFSFAEMAFFMRWWREQDADMRATVRRLVADGQLSFVNGGYVQNDEATAHYIDMIDQTTLGHIFLAETFGEGAVPRVGWQVDPFGHSSTQAALSVLYAFDAQFFGRADFQDMERRAGQREMEVLWRGARSPSPLSTDLFTGNFPSGNYGPPPGFNWDWGQTDPQMQDDAELQGYNVQERVDAFVAHCQAQFNVTRGNDIMLTMGTDFTYANAHPWYKNLDKLIHYVNKDGRLNIFYSTPEAYVKTKHSYEEEWPLKTDDFFPYADCPHCYWTGYFSSRPTAKGYIRAASAHLQSVRQLQVVADVAEEGGSTAALWEALSLAQHHDAITGTAKQHVANDYAQRISRGMAEADRVASRAISNLLAADRQMPNEDSREPSDDAEAAWKLCHLTNISVCATTVEATRDGAGFSVALWNPLPRHRQHHLRIPITTSGSNRLWRVSVRGEGGRGAPAAAQVLPLSRSTRRLQEAAAASAQIDSLHAAGDSEVAVVVQLPPLGLLLVDIQVAESQSEAAVPTHEHAADTEGGQQQIVRAGNGVAIQLEGGRLISLRTPEAEVKLDAGIVVYNSSDGGNGGVPSGAYIFRPNGSSFMDLEAAHVVKGDVVSEVRSSFHPWVQLTVRSWAGAPHIEVEWTVGPIPFEDGLGREVALRYGTDLLTGSKFSTDANGREMQPRVRNHRPTWRLNATQDGVAANYYPVTAAMEICEEGRAALAIVVDRAQGGTSLSSGQLEVMLHRRVLHDDWRGVGEALNETACGCRGCSCDGLIARGTHLLVLEGPHAAARQRRRAQQELTHPPLVAFKRHSSVGPDASSPPGNNTLGGGMGEDVEGPAAGKLPENVQLLTLQFLSPARLLLRLEHVFQAGEDDRLSHPAEVDLLGLLRAVTCGRQVDAVYERTLSAALPLADVHRLKWKAGRNLSIAPDLSEAHQMYLTNEQSVGVPLGTATTAGTLEEAKAMDAEVGNRSVTRLALEGQRVGGTSGWEKRVVNGSEGLHCSGVAREQTLIIELEPMQIRTWVVNVNQDAARYHKFQSDKSHAMVSNS